MKIGIIGAMEEEITLIKNDMVINKEYVIADRTFYEGTLYDKDIVLVLARIGKVAAATTTTLLIAKFEVDIIIFTGIAGAVDSLLNIGDIVISNNFVQHDMDASPIFPKYEIPILGITEITVPYDIIHCVLESAKNFINNNLMDEIDGKILSSFGIKSPSIHVGTIASGDQFIKDPVKINQIQEDIKNAKCVEMEGAAVAQVCKEFGLPCVVIRTISDKADHSAQIDFQKFLPIASYFSRGIINQLFTSILELEHFFR